MCDLLNYTGQITTLVGTAVVAIIALAWTTSTMIEWHVDLRRKRAEQARADELLRISYAEQANREYERALARRIMDREA